MKVVLQDKKTGCFFAEGNRWVADIDDAVSFDNSVEAQERAQKEGLSNVHILIKTNTGNDIRIRCDC